MYSTGSYLDLVCNPACDLPKCFISQLTPWGIALFKCCISSPAPPFPRGVILDIEVNIILICCV